MQLNAHDKPPAYLKAIFKKYQKISTKDLDDDENILDLSRTGTLQNIPYTSVANSRKASDIQGHFAKFIGRTDQQSSDLHNVINNQPNDIQDLELDKLPGFLIIPGLIPLDIQKAVLSTLFHRDLQNPSHKTNVHLHHHISYPNGGTSFFSYEQSREGMVEPKDSSVHKPMSLQQFMNKKLRWMTLGGQYDWTHKAYPEEEPPPFPPDLADLLHNLFPQTKPEAAIVNLYSPGDTLSLHRDVSEDCDSGLISLSIGCDALFIAGLSSEDDQGVGKHVVMRIKSGDALYMTGSVRYAWHGVPMIVPETCPKELRDWPYDPHESSLHDIEAAPYKQWRGWMASKRINLNVRQMRNQSQG